jgi:hypothetical protein
VGVTRGAAILLTLKAISEACPVLWVETINSNIDRYYDRYFVPLLKQLQRCVAVEWNAQRKLLKLGSGYIDFRSAEHPEMIEGFAYKYIFLNEAGIILKDDYLYTHTILPMLLDYPDSQLIAAGVPKGIHKRDGSYHRFYLLYQDAISGKEGYRHYAYTTYDNPFIRREDIEEMKQQMSDLEVRQEIYGEFVEAEGNNPFAYNFRDDMVSDRAVYQPGIQLILSFDFNLNPFACTVHQIWRTMDGVVHHYVIDEFQVFGGSITLMAEKIRCSQYAAMLSSARITGDYVGTQSQMNNAAYFIQLINELRLTERHLHVSPNPSHAMSRAHVNKVLATVDFRIHPRCEQTISDLRNVQCDNFGQIVKHDRRNVNQRADFLDTVRYVIHNFHDRRMVEL